MKRAILKIDMRIEKTVNLTNSQIVGRIDKRLRQVLNTYMNQTTIDQLEIAYIKQVNVRSNMTLTVVITIDYFNKAFGTSIYHSFDSMTHYLMDQTIDESIYLTIETLDYIFTIQPK